VNLLALVLTLSLQQLTDAAFRGERIDAEVARVEYHVAFSEWMDSQTVGGDSALAAAAAKRAMADVDRALALDPDLVEAHVLRSRIAFALMFHGAMPFDEARKLMSEAFAAAKKLAPEDPLVTSVEATFRDGKSKTMPDLRGVAWRAEGDRVWFVFALANAPDPTRIGMNLALDLDDDQNNGGTWWAGNKGFRYDRVVTVWVARGADGRYRGSSGVADAADIVRGRFTTSPAGTVSFAVDGENLFLGVKRDALSARGKLRLVATVGSNTDWNDVAPAEGSALLDMH
jgi:hypothetical protein